MDPHFTSLYCRFRSNYLTIKSLLPALAILALAGACSADTLNIVDGDFSAVLLVPCGGYAYQASGGACSDPTVPDQDFNSAPGIGWTFAGGSGLTGPSTAFNPPDFNGLFTLAAFLQGSGSFISQSVDGFVDSEIYTASFYLGSRFNNSPNDGIQTVSVLIDNVLVDQYTLASSTPFALITTDSFSVTTGPHTLTLEGTADGDHTAFVSDISLTGSPTPEPATFVLIGGGLIGMWSIGKRKRRA
jgi:PEP-CTERM motif